MNIKDAKNEIIHTLAAYLKKDGNGAYTYPLVRQRPILLIGPPGIGKTAVMEQVAAECRVGLWLTPSRIILVRAQWDFQKL
ncbi:MAG: AAA family ATPase [Ruminococcus sp.]